MTNESSIINKLPLITLGFWVLKIAATTLGETGADFFKEDLELTYMQSSMLMIGCFLVLASIQIAVKKYVPFLFWAVILSTSVYGTAMADCLSRQMKLGYYWTTLILVSVLAVIFIFWRITGSTMSVTDIRTRKVEALYWLAILFSNTLGTAVGDSLDEVGVGFRQSVILIGGIIALVAVLAYVTKISRVLLFWIAFVLTRPFGATSGDWLTKPVEKGGLNIGTAWPSGTLLAILVIGVIWVMIKLRRQPALQPAAVEVEETPAI
ncbi:MAG: hypothetical protein LLG01_10985 [Planctomycetaceae bacterium]|nr:hypothetical protein [Planctomycetaceae bacterium]